MIQSKIIIIFFIVLYFNGFTQNQSNLVYVDSNGRLKWTQNNEEAYFFGVNYSVPFAFSYRALKNKGISHEEIIDLDVQQFKKLELNAYRIHVWDREVSDKDGNLLKNEHIELLDYLISKLIENDIYIILTPIAWWGTGWPEPDYPTPGFSSFYSKIESTTKPEVINAQINYLKQFVNHKNHYTGKSYKDEQKIIAFEIFNEPNLPKDRDSVKNYVNITTKAIREEGVTKPIFFNISENPGLEQWEGVVSSDVEGISFQWYPTGLLKNSELKGNFLPNVLSYPLNPLSSPLSERGKRLLKNKAKMVYEFDAADIGKSHLYPVMAHSFREAGMQWATMFCYDPTSIAQYNAEYQTHYLNLLYTPQKALSLLIASNLFKEKNIPKKKFNGTSIEMRYYKVDYPNDLSILYTTEKFYYSNSNSTFPPDINSLRLIAGYGNSKIIEYDGRGSYFLEKIVDGIWRLEVYPDAVWIKDPFGRNNPDESVAKLIWKKHKMKIRLPDLIRNFNLFRIDETSSKISSAKGSTVELMPGNYLLSNTGDFSEIHFGKNLADFRKIKSFGEFIDNLQSIEIKNLTPGIFKENEDIKIKVEIYSKDDDIEPFIYLKKSGWRDFRKFQMRKEDDFTYEFTVPEELSVNGIINYFVCVKNDGEVLTFPGKLDISPEHWTFNQDNPSFELSILPPSNKTLIYYPVRDKKNLILPNIWRYVEYNADYTFDETGEIELNLKVTKVKEDFPELAFQIYVGDYLKDISPVENNSIELELMKISDYVDSISIRCIFDDGSGFERKLLIKDEYKKILIPLSKPEKVKYALLPRPYPVFLPYWFESVPQTERTERKLESVQIAIPLDDIEAAHLNGYGIKIKKINFIDK